MANRYWVGNGGNWSDNTNHWAASSGGAPGQTLPGASDDVFFDAASFSTVSQTVTLDSGTPTTKSFNCTGLDQAVTISGSLGLINKGGTITLNSNLTMAFTGTWTIKSTGLATVNITINSANLVGITGGITISSDTNTNFPSFACTWNFLDNFIAINSDLIFAPGTSSTNFTANTGTLETNNYTVSVKSLTFNAVGAGGTAASVNGNLGTSTINTASIILNNTGSGTVPHLTISGATSTVNFTPVASPQSKLQYNYLSGGGFTVTWGIINVAAGTGSFLFTTNDIGFSTVTTTFSAGSSVTITDGTLTVSGTFTANGVLGNIITITDGSITAAIASVSYITVTNNTAAGAAIPFDDRLGGVDGGGNTNWLFALPSISPSKSPSVSPSPTDTGLPGYHPSIITAVQRVQQNLSFPQFVIGGRGGAGGSAYSLFKKTDVYGFHLWRSPVYNIGSDFDVMKIQFNLDLDSGASATPVLYFDGERDSSVGNSITQGGLINLTSKNFNNDVHGQHNFFIEFQFDGLAVLNLPIFADIEVYEN